MRFSILRSGSSGNCTYIEHGSTRVLLDAGGMSRKKIVALLEETGVPPSEMEAVVCTHLHSDHLSAATLGFCRSFSVPVWIHHECKPFFLSTFSEKQRSGVYVNYFETSPFSIADICFEPFEVSHDAAGVTSGFRFFARSDGRTCSAGYAADLGHACDEVVGGLSDVKVLCLEANHDTEMLWKNPYRTFIHKKRVTGKNGHLSNVQCAEALISIIESSSLMPEKIVLCHLSEDHNCEQTAIEHVREMLSARDLHIEIIAASRHRKTGFFELCDI